MKKRVLSMLLAFTLCFSTVPMTAFAQETEAVAEQEEREEQQEVTDPAAVQEEAVAAPKTSVDESTTAENQDADEETDIIDSDSADESVSGGDAGEQDTKADAENDAAVQVVQTLIDALPDEVTAENADELQAQLMAIDEAMAALTEEQIAALDMERYDAICAALTQLVAVQDGEHIHPICGATCNDGENHQSVTWTPTSVLTDNMEVGNYYLTTDITLEHQWAPTNKINLCLNGHKITFTKNNSEATDQNVIVIKNVQLNLCDAHGQGAVIAAVNESTGTLLCGGVYIENGIFNLYDNAKINAHDYGVWINQNGSFTMYGGTVTGKAREGVHVSQAATFDMKGGEISGCETNGGVLVMGRSTSDSNSVVGGKFNMTGGKICNNTSTDAEDGGGVTLYYGQYGYGSFTMKGGEISGNKAEKGNGGGVYIKCDASNPSYYPGGFTMEGGKISDNTASGKGGGVYVEANKSSRSFNMFIVGGDAKITDNAGSNVYLCDNNKIVISWYGGLKSGANVGVTLEKLPENGDYTVIATRANYGYVEEAITSDDEKYKIHRSNDEVVLYSETTTLHEHPVCGKTCDHVDAHVGEVWKGVSSLDEITTSGNYYLKKDIELANTWETPAAGVKLCLNGHSITATANVNVIKISESNITLTDCEGDQGKYGKITHEDGKTGCGIYANSSFTMYGGEISGNTTEGYYGAVNVEYGTFTMHGGNIINNKASYLQSHGGGVNVSDNGTFTMDGGSITGNSAAYGGGVYSFGNFIVSGDVKITDNTAMDGQTANNVMAYKTIQVDTPGLDSTAKIGVTTKDIAEGSYAVVAEGIEAYKKSYQLTETDLSCFGSDIENYTPKLINNNIVFANGDLHEHPICGKTDCTDGHDDALWIPLTYENNQLKYGGNTAKYTTTTGPAYANIDKWDTITEYTLPEGNYYLSDDITIDGTIKIGGNVNLCLNGYTISTNSNKVSYAVIYTQYWKLSICDCTGKGSLKVPNNGVTNGIRTSAGIDDEGGTFYLYGGTITGGNCGVYVKGQLYLYGGTITGNGCGVSDAQKITIGGDVEITNNKNKNVELSNGEIITIDESLTKDAQIGITTFPKPSETTPSIQIATGANSSLKYTDIFKSDVTDYVITQTGTDLYLGLHQHNWTYSAEGATITIKCDADNCNLGTDFAATYTVTAPADADLVYSGTGKTATVTVSDNATGLGLPAASKVPITYTKSDGTTLEEAPVDAGTYKASITLEGVTASVTYAIASKVVANPTIEVTGTYTYDGTEKTPSVVVKDGTDVIDKGEYNVSYTNNINAGTATVTITDVAGGNYNVSGSTTFNIGKATITVTPDAGQKKTYGDANDPTLKYSSAGAENSEVPAFTGALSRTDGTNAGKYDITIGTLALADNSAGDFKAANYELKLADTAVQFEIVPKTLTADDLEFTADSIFTKTYDKTTTCTTAVVQIRSSASVDENDELPTVAGTYVYNSENVKDADKVIFTSEAASTQNYILPAGLTVEHEAEINKAGQKPLIITPATVPYGTDYDLTKIVSGGSGTGEVTYTVTNGSGVATITGSILHPVKVGEVTVVAVKAADDNYYRTTSNEKTVTISRVDYTGTVSKTVNIIKNRGTAQTGTLTAADFFPDGSMPDGAVISNVNGTFNTVVAQWGINKATGEVSYTSAVNIIAGNDESCEVTISSTNYNDIKATLTFHPTDKVTVTIDGLTYTNKTYDGSAIEPTGTLKVSDDKVPVEELEVKYVGINGTTYDSTEAPTNAGTYKVTYKVADSNADYTGEKEYTFTISPKAVTADMIGAIAAQEYTGSAITPTPEVKDGNTTLTAGTDFEFSYDKNTDASENTATVTITGKGNYTGTASKTFTIKPKDISGAEIKLENSSFTYDSIEKIVKIASVKLGEKALGELDYEIKEGDKFISANDAITLTIAGKGNYTGTATTTWKISKATPILGNFDVTDLSVAQPYDGKPKEVTAKTKNGVIDMGEVTVYYEGTSGTTYTRSTTVPTNAGTYKVILSVAEGKNYTAAEIEAGTLTIKQATLNVEDVTEFFEHTKTGEQTINVGNLVPGATSYALGAYTDDNGILSGNITIDETGLMEFTLSTLTKANIDNKVTVPVTITSKNYEDVTVNVTIYISPEYRITEGANSSWTQNTNGTIVIRGNGDCKIFKDVKVDGKVIDHSNYKVTEGSTIITLKAEYLKTLSTGSHTFAIVWNNGIASTNFTVAANTPNNNGGSSNNDSSDNSSTDSANNTDIAATTNDPTQELDKVPATGDPFGIWLTLFVISLTGFAGMLARRKKN